MTQDAEHSLCTQNHELFVKELSQFLRKDNSVQDPVEPECLFQCCLFEQGPDLLKGQQRGLDKGKWLIIGMMNKAVQMWARKMWAKGWAGCQF